MVNSKTKEWLREHGSLSELINLASKEINSIAMALEEDPTNAQL